MTTFKRRQIEMTFSLGRGQFGEEKGPDVTVTGYRTSVSISLPGGATHTNAHFRVFGLPKEMTDRLTRIGPKNGEYRVNRCLIAAGNEGETLSVVHSGFLETAYADFNNAPNTAFEVISMSGLIAAMKPVPPRSYTQAVNVSEVLAAIAKDLGVAFESNGVSVMINRPYLSGTTWEQIKSIAEAARINYSLDNDVLAIWTRDGSRTGRPPVDVSPGNGLVGYPVMNSRGVGVRMEFNPLIALGARINLTSAITAANGNWVVFAAYHTLEAETPNGQWFTDVLCSRDFANE